MSEFVDDWKALFENQAEIWIHPDSTEDCKAIAALCNYDRLYLTSVLVHGQVIHQKFKCIEDATKFGEYWFAEFSKRVVANKIYVFGTMHGGLEISSSSNGATLTREEADEFIRVCQERITK